MSKSEASPPDEKPSKVDEPITSPPSPDTSISELTDFLIKIGHAGMKALNNRDWNGRDNDQNLNAILSPEFRVYFGNNPEGLSVAENAKWMREFFLEKYPEHRVEVIQVTPEVFEKEGTAVVYVECDEHNAPPGVMTRVIYEFKWRKEEDGWRCFHMSSMRAFQ
ncbi:unnamed protein product [Zymoseptoria tritici ST99CH_1A5]|uniref:SnoaL-like domain-containing protein n=3 Tax=Zymoseptoria tritici TaxID=1047171 RepID=A0A1X7S6R5_ZYMT9|nr:unnamed protein product [Zymoseptoria tritici ST99CH_3D7]SMR60588.1 unnamed protein product [Zymoseptoria tritici ST99CH_1E4]SMY29058.1 unnamed protein product [Zymoseptoria tritici ST99CH_1A5]